MSDENGGHTPDRWLEVTGEEGKPKAIHCPRRGRDMPLHECLGCARYDSLAIDPAGKHVYIDCAWDGTADPGEPPGQGTAPQIAPDVIVPLKTGLT